MEQGHVRHAHTVTAHSGPAPGPGLDIPSTSPRFPDATAIRFC